MYLASDSWAGGVLPKRKDDDGMCGMCRERPAAWGDWMCARCRAEFEAALRRDNDAAVADRDLSDTEGEALT